VLVAEGFVGRGKPPSAGWRRRRDIVGPVHPKKTGLACLCLWGSHCVTLSLFWCALFSGQLLVSSTYFCKG
jgi:hypothetical protein